MIEVTFSLYRADDEPEDGQVRHCKHVPRVGDYVAFDHERSYVVADVLWHLIEGHEPHVTVHAFERGWHANTHELTSAWREQLRSAEEE